MSKKVPRTVVEYISMAKASSRVIHIFFGHQPVTRHHTPKNLDDLFQEAKTLTVEER